jgi:uncharacterized protein (DUF2141 family)
MGKVGFNALNKKRILTTAFLIAGVLTGLELTSPPTFATETCPGIHIEILNIKNSVGTVDCALFDSPEGFPREVLHSARGVVVLKIRDTKATCNFEGIAPGTYAIAVIHDQDMNGKLDTNALGIPTEGYAFSNDVHATLHAPSFSAAKFEYDGGRLDLTISLHY